MLLSRHMATAFGDWLERERIHAALVSARPELDGRLEREEERPLLRIPRPDGAMILVVRTEDAQETGWIVGIPHPRTPILLEPHDLGELVEQVLEALDDPAPRADGTPSAD